MVTPFGIGMRFQMMNILSLLIFGAAFVLVLMGLIRTFSEWHKNNNSPRLTVEATVVTKRTARQRPMSNKRYSGRDYTNYYTTFQFESGDRLELQLQGHEYGMIVEGDKGRLTFQGSRYLGFERT